MWAFGCVLYELLTGRRAFEAEDVSDTLVAILRDEPDWPALPQGTPAPIRRLLRHCLAKDPKRRIGDASVARIEIDDVETEPPVTDQRAQRAARDRLYLTSAVALAVVSLAAASAMLWMFQPATRPPPRLTRFPIALPHGPTVFKSWSSPDRRVSRRRRHRLHREPAVVSAAGRSTRGSSYSRHPGCGPHGRPKSILLSRWTVDWLLAGRAVQESPDLRRCADRVVFGTKPVGRELDQPITPFCMDRDPRASGASLPTAEDLRTSSRSTPIRSPRRRNCSPVGAPSCSRSPTSPTRRPVKSWSSRSIPAPAASSWRQARTRNTCQPGHLVYALGGTLLAIAV